MWRGDQLKQKEVVNNSDEAEKRDGKRECNQSNTSVEN